MTRTERARRWLRSVAVVVCVLLGLTSAHADTRRDAKRAFQRGMELVRQGRTDEAVTELRRAYRIKPHPNVLYNIARAYDVAGRVPEAVTAYEEYLAAGPAEPGLAEARLTELREQLARERPAEPPPAAPDASTPAAQPSAAPVGSTAAALLRAASAWEARARELEAQRAAPSPQVTPPTSAPEPPSAPADGLPPRPAVPPTPAPQDEGARSWLTALFTTTASSVAAADEEATEAGGAAFYERTVVSASRTGRSAVYAPASVGVITDEDIRSSGARTIPDLLRRVASVDVVSMSASDQNVSIRGFNQRVSNRVLVLIDGRSVYQDFLGATFWQSLPITLEDIERIEVIRGPGAALYGANAVVGIINIITRAPGEGPRAQGRVTVGWPLMTDAAMRGSLRRGPVGLAVSTGYVRQRKWALELDRRRGDQEAGFPDIPFDLSSEVVRTNATATLQPLRWLNLTARLGLSRTTQEVYAIGALRNFLLDGWFGHLTLEGEAGPLRMRVFYNGARARVGPQIRAVAGRESLTELRSDVVDAEGTFTTRFRLLGEHRAVAGASYRLKNVAWGFLAGTQLEQHAGLFGEDTWVGPGGHRVVVSGRLDRHPLVGLVPSARGAFVFNAWKGMAVRAVLGTAFRNPTFLESYLDATPQSPVAGVSIKSTGSRTLRPEQNIMAELGFSSEVGDAATLEAAVYFGRLRGLIVQSGLVPPADGNRYDQATGSFIAGESRFVNDNDVLNQVGGEAGFTLNPYEGIDLYANYAYLRVSSDTTGLPNQQTPTHKLNGGGRLRTPVGIVLSLDGHLLSQAVWVERQFSTDEPGGVRRDALTVPPYALLEGRAAYRVPGDHLEFFVQSDNMLGVLPADVASRAQGTPLYGATPYAGPLMAHREHPFGNPSGARVMAGMSGQL